MQEERNDLKIELLATTKKKTELKSLEIFLPAHKE
jgi:hypothetical protein